MLLLYCPKCRNKMKYDTKDKSLAKKRKVCVYCGKSFSVIEHIVERI